MRTVLPILVLVLLPVTAPAQGWIEPRPDRPGQFGVVRVRTEVTARVADRVALVEVEEWFENRGGGLGEGDYLYPLAGEAVFSNFSLFQGDQELRGETMDARQARGIYEEIVRRRKDPALIELAGHGLIRARVFPINPGETRKITLRYTQVLERAGDALQFRYAAGLRHPGHALPAPDTRPRARPASDSAPVSFTLITEDGERFRDPFSPTHEVRVRRDGGRITVRPASTLQGDFAVFLPLARGLVGMTLVTHRPSGEDGYFMLTLSPGRVRREAAVPRDLTVVVDVSGSMSGSKMEQAREALRQLLGTLGPADRFRLVAFSNAVRSYRSGWTPAGPRELAAAAEWVDGLQADGGTNISGALAEAFRLESPESRLPIVLFVTDGLPSVGEQDPERIARQAERSRGRTRVFAFGVGYDVNTYLLDRLSAAGRGSTEYVEPDEDVERALGLLSAKIRHPVLTDLTIARRPVRLEEVYPTPLPDLFAGEELVIFGRYRADGDVRGELAVTGRRAGEMEHFTAQASFPEHETGNDYVPRLWAARKLGALTQQIRLNGADPELVEEVRETALRYGLLSEYTSYLVQEPMEFTLRDGNAVALDQLVVTGAPAAPPPPPAPARATGASAVRSAERAGQQRAVRSEAELQKVEALEARAGEPAGGRVVAGRRFVQRGGVWTDVLHREGLRVVEVEPFSRAYFELLRRLPELEPYWREFERSVVAGREISLRVAPGGKREITAAELARLVREFRGR